MSGPNETLFDTNILIDYLQGIEKASNELNQYKDRQISVITKMEILVGTTEEEQETIREFLNNLSRSGYYEWLNNSGCNRDREDHELTKKIKIIFKEGRSNYGTRPIKKELSRHSIIVSRRRIVKLMQKASLICKTKRKFKATTDSHHNKQVALNLLDRKFTVPDANCYWVGDITYVPTSEGWLYLATVMDLFSRKIIGWSMSNNMKADLVNNALLMAIWQRKPPKGLIWHTDRGGANIVLIVI